jgi:hypothetical protein
LKQTSTGRLDFFDEVLEVHPLPTVLEWIEDYLNQLADEEADEDLVRDYVVVARRVGRLRLGLPDTVCDLPSL